jgi:hypothetical protein
MELDIKLLVENKLTPNSYVYLYYLVNDMICPIPLPSVSLTNLENRKYIKILSGRQIARRKARVLIDPEYVYAEPVEIVENWIEEWRELFPAGVKTGGYYVRGSKAGCLKKMKSFLKLNKKVTKNQIMSATKLYINESRSRRYSYMKMADYFINKDGTSMLESYLEQAQSKNIIEFDATTNNMADDI